jgi:hypothetical protein
MLAAFAVAGSCSTQLGGEGQLSDGQPLSVIMQIDMTATTAVTVIDIASPDGWSCRSSIANDDNSTSPRARHIVPMNCSDGATGTLLITYDAIQKTERGAFKLSNGRSGSFAFNFKR